ncbi:DUF5818 domain-containing protein [Micromonospora sp. C95]|uniref:DUF5818 domain-containing protein n=1 Tax=Micromonospora sp. C95 TaxID=2824882 RepID=UPI001B36A839|nr:DUF5818 domain-containing protein [Micromonospora sp. C95]MBQ1026327.1 hypothetical protein [Micromonospora sp. C95]
MPTTIRTRAPAACLAALLALAGCGEPDGGAVTADQRPTATGSPTVAGDATAGNATGQPPVGRTGEALSPTDPPLIGTPTAPPRHPTELRKTNVLAGRLSQGGSGPCYTLVTDDGREYALHGADKGTFATGTWVRVTTAPATAEVDCGPGIPVSILKMSQVG